MIRYIDIPIGELFDGINGKPKFIRDYLDVHPGKFPVYSASLTKPFGFVDEYEFEGTYLTWVMNGYGGRVQEISGRFSTNRDRGVFIPKKGVTIPDLTYLRHIMESQLVASAVGRRVDGRLNEYTKIYPDTALQVQISLPATETGALDFEVMERIGKRLRSIEEAQNRVRQAQEPLFRAAFSIDVPAPFVTVGLDDEDVFSLSIGNRITAPSLKKKGIPVYSANVTKPFGNIEHSNLAFYDMPSLLWGIDGNFDWNFIPAGEQFATTDHCGRLQILNKNIDPVYVYWFLHSTRWKYGFDRVYRASLRNMRAEVMISFPLDKKTGEFSLEKQQELAEHIRKREHARTSSLVALEGILKARINIEALANACL
ncbi:restriction endonuclease subunit S [Mariprofundus ferrooxydans]|uniref:restriction endonuclease subunit S n=1 Tax=Mariprofundus ferrooxydans TaxID=314344 RepID=UPI0014321B5D|nr:restriction endonuclease subunit S [Mariprofundus ferrooxydans]